MSSRWFIPASLAIFAGFIAVIWLYLAATQEPAASIADSSIKESAIDRELDGLMISRPRASAPAIRPNSAAVPVNVQEPGRPTVTARGSLPRRPSLSQLGAQMAEHLDEASVQFRGGIARSALAQEARGLSAAAVGDHEAALRHLNQTLAKHPHDAVALAARADSLVALERFDEAAQVYREVARLSPRDFAARYNHAVVLWRLSRFDEAARELREVVRLKPDHADAQYNLASLAQRDGRINEAREAWEAFTRLRPKVAGGWFNLGVVDMDFDEPRSAADAFARCTQLSPMDPDGWINLALAESASGHLDSALYALTVADDLSPCEGLILDLLAQVHETLAERDPAAAGQHLAAAARIRDLIGNPSTIASEPVETIAAGDKN